MFNTLQINYKMYKDIISHLYIIQRFYKFTKLKEFQRGQFWNYTSVGWPSNLHSHHSQHLKFQNLTTNLYILVHEHSFNKCLILTA